MARLIKYTLYRMSKKERRFYLNIKDIFEFNKPYNEENINTIIEKIKSNKIVPYIGAGMSMISSDIYPSWGGFLDLTFDKFKNSLDEHEYNSKNFEDKADYLYEKIGKITFSNHIKEVFAQEKLKDIQLEGKAISLIPKIFKESLILTTNYDKVIESSFARNNEVLTCAHPGHTEALNFALREENSLLFKVHGDINEPETSIILTKEQYDNAYSNDELKSSLQSVYSNKFILFLGCSLSTDRSIELLKQTCTAGMSHYAIIGSDEEHKGNRRLELENLHSIQSVIYPSSNHECLKTILEYISSQLEDYANKVNDSTKNKKVTSVELTYDWFINQNKHQIKNLGDRYSPELNVDTEPSRVFDSLNRNEKFKKRFSDNANDIIKKLKNMQEIRCIVEEICKVTNDYYNDIKQLFPYEKLHNLYTECKEVLTVELEKTEDRIHDIITYSGKSSGQMDELNRKNRKLYRDIDDIQEYIKYLNSSEIQSLNNPYILLHGTGGIGKSHLLADVITDRMNNEQKSLFFLGQHFAKNQDPNTRMKEILGLQCSMDNLLEALESECQDEKIIIFIDALNEGDGKQIWSEYLSGFVDKLQSHKNIGLVISVRSEYVDNVFSNCEELKKSFVNVKHSGFTNVEQKAIKKFFKVYDIPYLELPYIEHEYRSPLFLNMLCKSYIDGNVDLQEMNFLGIYEGYLTTINNQLSNKLNFSSRINIIGKLLSKIVEFKYENMYGNNLLSEDDATAIIMDLTKENNIQGNLIDELFSTGVITKSIYDDKEFIHITYEKLEDYMYSKILVEDVKELDIDRFKEKHADLQYMSDLIEMFAIVLAEQTEYEIFDIWGDEIAKEFFSSLKWRADNTITENIVDIVNCWSFGNKYINASLLESLISLSIRKNHKLNANTSFKLILSYKMPDRDSEFIPMFDYLMNDENSALNRLLMWGLNIGSNLSITEETVKLSTKMLSVFLISSNKSLRDKVTKAILNLLIGKIDCVIDLLECHRKTDDPYVIERLYAIAFGCIVFEKDNLKIDKLAVYTYNSIFNQSNVYENMPVRDYAKNIIDYAKFKIKSKDLDRIEVKAPYGSKMPIVPTDEEIECLKLDYESSKFKSYHWGQNIIISSMQVDYNRQGTYQMGGDFGKYVF